MFCQQFGDCFFDGLEISLANSVSGIAVTLMKLSTGMHIANHPALIHNEAHRGIVAFGAV